MRRRWLLTLAYALTALSVEIASAPVRQRTQQQLRRELSPNYVRAVAAYRRLERRLPRDELRALTTIGILNGAREAEQQMESHLIDVVKDLLHNTIDMEDTSRVMPKIDEIEEQLVRDQRALEILISALDLATRAKDPQQFRHDLQLQQAMMGKAHNTTTMTTMTTTTTQQQSPIAEYAAIEAPTVAIRIGSLRRHIEQQVQTMKSLIDEKIEHTLDQLIEQADDDGLLAKAAEQTKTVHKRNAQKARSDHSTTTSTSSTTMNDQQEDQLGPAEIRIIKSILSEADFRQNLVDERISSQRTDKLLTTNDVDDDFALEFDFKNVTATTATTAATTAATIPATIPATKTTTKNKNESAARQVLPETSVELMPDDVGAAGDPGTDDGAGGGGGGLVGIIGSLSGGEGGSDVGALIGALTGVISTLFGPGGLDIESLIGTATSLLAGLLSGNRNFGSVLGQYVGTAFDGLSGGGGAVNNGQFIGNFLGTVVASLSADPEDEGPPQPFVFAQNLLSGFLEAKNRKSSEEVSEERKASGETHQKQKKKKTSAHTAAGGGGGGGDGGGSDSGSFVKQIVAHVVSNVLGLLLNASLGASGGASQASSSLFSGSSSASHHTKAAQIISHHHGG